MDCDELVELVTEYLDGTMSRRERKHLERHLDECRGCRAYLEQMRETIRLTGMLSDESIPEQGRDELLVAFREWRSAG